jgi:hypothetical protein
LDRGGRPDRALSVHLLGFGGVAPAARLAPRFGGERP